MKGITKLILTPVILFIVIPFVFSQSITENGITITSDKDTYFCASFNNQPCIISGTVTIENFHGKKIDYFSGIDASTTIKIKDHFYMEKVKSKSHKTKQKVSIEDSTDIIIPFSFEVTESGKFDYFIEFDGLEVRLDPFYNVTYNATNPSLHLINGSDELSADSSFEVSIDITDELKDLSDSTKYETVFLQASNISFFITDDGEVDGTVELNNEGGFFNNFTLNFIDTVTQVEICVQAYENAGSPILNLSLSPNRIDAPLNFSSISLGAVPATEFTCVSVPDDFLSYFENTYSIMAGLVCKNCDGSNKIRIDKDADAPDQNKGYEYDGTDNTYNLDAGDDLFIRLNITAGKGIDKSIKAKFNLTIDSSNDYWLRTRKTTVGVTNVTVFSYENDDDSINISNSLSHLVTTGWDIIPLNYIEDIIYTGMLPSFRLFSSDSQEFSEVQLIEQIQDNLPPIISDCQINDTELGCNDWIRFSCNVTDNEIIDAVTYWYNDTSVKNQEADKIIDTDIYFLDIQYTGFDEGTYEFAVVNATDIVHLQSFQFLDFYYNYTCIQDFPPNTTLINPIDNNITDQTNINFTCSATDDISLSNMTLYHNLSGWDIIETKTLTGTGDNTFFIDTIPANNTIIWNCQACDSLNQCDFAPNNRTLLVTSLEQLSIELISPLNNSQLTGFLQTLRFSVNQATEIDLYIDEGSGFEITTINTTIGLNDYPKLFPQNQTITWYINGTCLLGGIRVLSETWQFSVQAEPPEIQTCEITTGTGILLLFFLILSISFIALPFILRIKELNIISGLILIISGIVFNFFICFTPINWLIGAIFVILGFFMFTVYITNIKL